MLCHPSRAAAGLEALLSLDPIAQPLLSTLLRLLMDWLYVQVQGYEVVALANLKPELHQVCMHFIQICLSLASGNAE